MTENRDSRVVDTLTKGTTLWTDRWTCIFTYQFVCWLFNGTMNIVNSLFF